MTPKMFSFDIDCVTSAISVDVFNEAVGAFSKMLVAAGASDWQVSEVRIASVHLTAMPRTDDENVQDSFDALNDFLGLAHVDKHDEKSLLRFQPAIKKISQIVKATGASVAVGVSDEKEEFTQDMIMNLNDEADRILVEAQRESFGHIEGRVDKIILQPKHRTLGIIDNSTEKRVEVAFESSLDKQVEKVTPGSIIDVKGFIRSPEGFPKFIRADDIQLMRNEHHNRVTAKNLEGLFSIQLPKEVNSVRIIRNNRDKDGMDEEWD